MHVHHILEHFAVCRQLNVSPFDLRLAIASDKPVYFWHTFNGVTYTGYQLLPTNSFGSNIAIGHDSAKDQLTRKKHIARGMLCPSFFLEHDGKLYPSDRIWPEDLVLWIGDGLEQRYRLDLVFTPVTFNHDYS